MAGEGCETRTEAVSLGTVCVVVLVVVVVALNL